jgi:hypothetical protein
MEDGMEMQAAQFVGEMIALLGGTLGFGVIAGIVLSIVD